MLFPLSSLPDGTGPASAAPSCFNASRDLPGPQPHCISSPGKAQSTTTGGSPTGGDYSSGGTSGGHPPPGFADPSGLRVYIYDLPSKFNWALTRFLRNAKGEVISSAFPHNSKAPPVRPAFALPSRLRPADTDRKMWPRGAVFSPAGEDVVLSAAARAARSRLSPREPSPDARPRGAKAKAKRSASASASAACVVFPLVEPHCRARLTALRANTLCYERRVDVASVLTMNVVLKPRRMRRCSTFPCTHLRTSW